MVPRSLKSREKFAEECLLDYINERRENTQHSIVKFDIEGSEEKGWFFHDV